MASSSFTDYHNCFITSKPRSRNWHFTTAPPNLQKTLLLHGATSTHRQTRRFSQTPARATQFQTSLGGLDLCFPPQRTVGGNVPRILRAHCGRVFPHCKPRIHGFTRTSNREHQYARISARCGSARCDYCQESDENRDPNHRPTRSHTIILLTKKQHEHGPKRWPSHLPAVAQH